MESALHKHPCYSEEAHHYFARMHAPVAPRCNIQCHYCNPKFDCVNESRPGVVSQLLSPDEACLKVSQMVSGLPNLTVVGIAGPGDPLANPEATFRTFALLAEAYPDLHLCLSTNGLMLPDYAEEIQRLGIRHVTVTMNALNPEIGSRIYAHVRYKGIVYKGAEAAALLIRRQLEGIRLLTARGILVKVNSVHIPEVNGAHLREVAVAVRKLGAFSHNIMPLILSPGSHYYKEHFRSPTLEETDEVQEASSRIMPVMRHCRQCRADAVGLIGADMSQMPEMVPPQGSFTLEDRAAIQDEIVSGMREAAAVSEVDWSGAVRAAVATRGSNVINQHFGHAREFIIYDVKQENVRLVGIRKVQAYCNGTRECGSPLSEALDMLKDCRLLLCSGIGEAPARKLQQAGITPLIRKGSINEQLLESARYLKYFQ
ncbi:nitrogenase cofactor biosynthesis protein NifB [Paenibacillus sp. S150]|uniref:nitrogenase cofactor biosynthesis protein NifB n=1 Tax=Paenibacillus sp. S150 TaxID=2749826 RepID=UPI001C57918A|nr:nitrogenase cofactor biosynthesis protein NifB [Paenibacillus sp. S150]MBW4082655.1 nitrogenase cofactor biosynthesis protein NifB [Paenibacillus sp. S150]